MQYSSPRRIFRKGEVARKKYLQGEEQFKISRYIQLPIHSQELSPRRENSSRRNAATARFHSKRETSLQRNSFSREMPETQRNSFKLSSFDKILQLEYKAKPILADRPNFMVRYKKMYKSYEQ